MLFPIAFAATLAFCSVTTYVQAAPAIAPETGPDKGSVTVDPAKGSQEPKAPAQKPASASAAATSQDAKIAEPSGKAEAIEAPKLKPLPADRTELRVKVRTQALKAGLPPQIADAVAHVESGYNASAIGSVGEVGIMQVLPSTARMLGFSGTNEELAESEANIRYGVTYLAQAWRLANQDICTTVMKYRAGHGETRFSYRSVDYCRRVRAILASQGYPVPGELPIATFGEPVAAGAAIFPVARPGTKFAKAGQRRFRSRINWAVADARMKAITARITTSSLIIAR